MECGVLQQLACQQMHVHAPLLLATEVQTLLELRRVYEHDGTKDAVSAPAACSVSLHKALMAARHLSRWQRYAYEHCMRTWPEC